MLPGMAKDGQVKDHSPEEKNLVPAEANVAAEANGRCWKMMLEAGK